MDKRRIAFGFFRMAGNFYRWAFRNIFRLVRTSDERIRKIEERKRRRSVNFPKGREMP